MKRELQKYPDNFELWMLDGKWQGWYRWNDVVMYEVPLSDTGMLTAMPKRPPPKLPAECRPSLECLSLPVKAPPQATRIKSPPAAHAQQAVKATVAPQGPDSQLIAPAVQPPPKVKAIPKPLPVKAPPHKMPPVPKPLPMKAPPPPWNQNTKKRIREQPRFTGFSELGSSSDSVPLGSPPGLAVPSSDLGDHWSSWKGGGWSWNETHGGGSRGSRWH